MLKSSNLALLVALTCLGAASFAPESRADEDIAFKIKRNANTWGRTVVRKFYDGGIDIETRVLDYAYSSKQQILWVKLSISFKGVFSDSIYRVVGEYEESPKRSTWKHTSMNSALKEWFILKGITKVGLEMLEEHRKK